MKFLVRLVLVIALLAGCLLGWLVLEKALFYRTEISMQEKGFYNEGLRLTSPEIIRAANFPHLGVLLGGSLFRYWFNPINDNWQLVNYGGIEESTVETSAKLKMFAAELKPEFVVINAGFCQIRTTVHNKQDVAQAIDSIMHNMHLMADEAKSRGIIPILSTLPPVRPAYRLPYSGLIDRPSREKPILNEAIQNINARIMQLASERNLPVVDFHKALADEKGLLRKEYSLNDGEHLNWKGYHALSDFFVRELTPIIQTSGRI